MSLWGPWTHLYGYAFQPGGWIPVALLVFLYWRGRRQIVRQGRTGDPRIGTWRAASFYCGMVSVLFALEGPINYLAYRLFWMHMVEHCLIQMVASLLILVGEPLLPWWRGLPASWQRAWAPRLRSAAQAPWLRGFGQLLRRPVVGVAALALTFWTWHVPFVFDVTLNSWFLHGFEFTTLLLGGLAYWSITVDSYPLRRQLPTWPLAGYLVAGTAVMWVVAISLGFSGHAWYAPYFNLSSRPGGISALTDQQWGAGVAWVPAAVPAEIMLDIAILHWLGEDERRADAEAEGYRRAQAALRDPSSRE